jgi:Phosphotransferase enzyme family
MTSTMRPADRPGTNVRGGASGASWRFLLPSLALDRVVILGAPSSADRRAIAAAGGRVSVPEGTRFEQEDGSVRTVIVLGPRGNRAVRDPAVRRELARVAAPDATVYMQSRDGALPEVVDVHPGAERTRLRIGTTDGDLRWAAPRADAAAGALARRLVADRGGGVRARVERALRRAVDRFRPPSDAAELVSTGDPSGPPRYLVEAAASGDLDLTGRRWAMAIPGLYASNKAVFLLFPADRDEPDVVIKVARTAAQNPRLEREAAVLEALGETRWNGSGSAPRRLFLGSDGGARILGETALRGEPFRRRTTAQPGCPYAREVVERLIDLGAETAAAGDASVLRARSLELFDRYRTLYRPDRRHAAFLRQQLDAIGASQAAPTVFQHGDPGAWNILADADGSIRFLDWEAADPAGVPLWDLFYFLRSFGVTVSRSHGTDDALSAYHRWFLEPSDLSRVQAEAIHRAGERIGLPSSMIEPLFHTCWMHRAVKQAARLPRWKLRRGHYHRLLIAGIEGRDAPGLRALFAGG